MVFQNFGWLIDFQSFNFLLGQEKLFEVQYSDFHDKANTANLHEYNFVCIQHFGPMGNVGKLEF